MEAMEEDQVQAEGNLQGGNTKIDMSLANMTTSTENSYNLSPLQDKINMVFNEIIKLQKEESDPQPSSSQAGESLRTRRNFRNQRFFRGPPRTQQGPGRPKAGFKQQRFFRTNTRNASFGPVTRQRAAASFSGVSPLNRPYTSSPSSQSSEQAQSQKARQITKKYRASPVAVQMITRSRNNLQNRTSQFRAGQGQQRTNAVNENRRLTQQFSINRGKRQLNTRRWQNKEGFGTTLTVSVSNPKANRAPQAIKPGMKQSGGKFRKTGIRPSGPPPKGVPLRFNFRAMANHTNVTLNDRFSTLKIKGQFTPGRRGGRMVTLA